MAKKKIAERNAFINKLLEHTRNNTLNTSLNPNFNLWKDLKTKWRKK